MGQKTGWVTARHPEGYKRKGKWALQAYLGDDDKVYAPAAIAGGEQYVFLCAAFDGVDFVLDAGHVYLPVDWLAAAFPEVAEVAEKIDARVRQTLAEAEDP